MRRAPLLILILTLALAACASPPSHFTRIWPEGDTGVPLHGLSTEDGVLILADPHLAVGDRFRFQFPVGNSVVEDWAVLDRRNDDLAILRPLTSRLHEGRFATVAPTPDEPFYLALRTPEDEAQMVEVERWHGGQYGAFIEPWDSDPRRMARDWAGAGLYVERDGRWEIVGILAGLTARPLIREDDDDLGLGYLDLSEISRLLPDQVDFFEHPILPPRADFEYGMPLREGDLDVDEVLEQPSGEDGTASP